MWMSCGWVVDELIGEEYEWERAWGMGDRETCVSTCTTYVLMLDRLLW